LDISGHFSIRMPQRFGLLVSDDADAPPTRRLWKRIPSCILHDVTAPGQGRRWIPALLAWRPRCIALNASAERFCGSEGLAAIVLPSQMKDNLT
jgi:hypothetical protein